MEKRTRRELLSSITAAAAIATTAACASSPIDSSGPSTRKPGRDFERADAVLNIRDYGAIGDGRGDDTQAIERALADAKELESAAIFFPPGRYLDSGLHTTGRDTSLALIGSGPGVSQILRHPESKGEWWNILTPHATITGLTFDGSRAKYGTDGLGVNASYVTLDSLVLIAIRGTSIKIGRSQNAIAVRLNKLLIRKSHEHHIHVTSDNLATDGLWADIDAGICGKSGIRIESGAQNLTNVHVWQSGLAGSSSNSGIELASSNNALGSGWQSEKNIGAGVKVEGSSNIVASGRAWGNAGAGILLTDGSQNIVNGNLVRDNFVTNVESGIKLAVIDSVVRDNLIESNLVAQTDRAISPGTAQGEFVRVPYPGRAQGAPTVAPTIRLGKSTQTP